MDLGLLSFVVLITSVGRSTWCVPPPPRRRGVLGLAVGTPWVQLQVSDLPCKILPRFRRRGTSLGQGPGAMPDRDQHLDHVGLHLSVDQHLHGVGKRRRDNYL